MVFFKDSSKLLILSLAGSRRFLRLFTATTCEGSRRLASPHGVGLSPWSPALGIMVSLCCSSHDVSWHKAMKRSNCELLTFLLMFREDSNGFWMCNGVTSGLWCSLPCRRGTQRRATKPIEIVRFCKYRVYYAINIDHWRVEAQVWFSNCLTYAK